VHALLVLADRALVLRLGFVDRLLSLALRPGGAGLSLATAFEWLTVHNAEARPAMADRTSAMQTAYAYYSHTWHCSQSNYYTCGGSARPGYITTADADCYEVPYQYGGYQSVSQFDSDMTGNKTAGDVNCDHDPRTCASVVDRSGFIQNCWGQTSQKYGDGGLVTNFGTGQVGNTELWPADMWRRPDPAHVRLHDGCVPEMTGAFVYESSTANGGRVWYRYYDLGDLDAFEPRRWRGY